MKWNVCRNSRCAGRGIKVRDRYLGEHSRISPEFIVKVGPPLAWNGGLIESASGVTSAATTAWEGRKRIGHHESDSRKDVPVRNSVH